MQYKGHCLYLAYAPEGRNLLRVNYLSVTDGCQIVRSGRGPKGLEAETHTGSR